MNARPLYALCGCVVAFGVATAFDVPADANDHTVGVAYKSTGAVLPPIVDKTCYSQRDADNGVGIVSQNFEPAFDAYDSQGADDFTVKKKKCISGQGASAQAVSLTTITADGTYFSGSGPADSFNVTYYKDSGGTPGAVVKNCREASYTDGSGTGTPTIACPAKLRPGRYWVSVQANMDYGTGGEWGWLTNNTVRGEASQWQNPGDGFATGCTSYDTTTTCLPLGEGGDFSFSLAKKK